MKKKRVFGRGWLWEQHLLEDSYDCLEGEYYDNLETILNESLTVGYGDIEGTFKGENPRNPSRDGEADEILFFLTNSTIYGARSLAANRSRLIPDSWNWRWSVCGRSLPIIRFSRVPVCERRGFFAGSDKRFHSTRCEPEFHRSCPGRVCWFLTLIQHSKNKDFAHVMRHMYGLAVRRLVRGPSNASLPQEAVDYIFMNC